MACAAEPWATAASPASAAARVAALGVWRSEGKRTARAENPHEKLFLQARLGRLYVWRKFYQVWRVLGGCLEDAWRVTLHLDRRG